MKPRFVNKRELAEFLGLSVFTIDSWVSQRRIPFVKLSKRVLFDMTDIEAWIAENKIQPRNNGNLN